VNSRNDNISAINRTGFGFDQQDESNIQIVQSQASLEEGFTGMSH